MPDQLITKPNWQKFHETLSKEFGLTWIQVGSLRSLAIGFEQPRKDIALWAATKLSQSKRHVDSRVNKRTHGKLYYQGMLNSTASCTDAQWSSLCRDYGG
jgi:hypothetical protein